MPVPRLTPSAYRTITLLALAALCVIVVSGAAVRISGSGLGCPEWPNCGPHELAPHGDLGGHAGVEFGNRVFTGLVSVAVIVAVLGSLVRVPRRRDLTQLSLGLVGGVLAQVVLGGITVKVGLAPQVVMAHLLLSLVLVANAVVLVERAGTGVTGASPSGPGSPASVRTMGRGLVLLAGVVVVTGTVVTGSGPHGGDATARRLSFLVKDVARVHGVAVNMLVAATLLTLWLLARAGSPAVAVARARTLLAVEVAQAAVGYTQYFTGVPELLVAVHVAGAVAVWLCVCRFAVAAASHAVVAPTPPPTLGRVPAGT